VVASAPLVSVAIAALALGERLTAAKIAGSSVAIAGVAVVSLARSGASVTSALWIVVGAAVVQGVYHPLTKPLLRTRSALEVPVATSTSLLYLVPPVAVFIAFVWLGETPRAGELLGGLVVLAGVVLVTQGDRLRAHLRPRHSFLLSTHQQARQGS
jgi:drug/metabolite transporter (DMT)-like permease